jgi:hypothetical protein
MYVIMINNNVKCLKNNILKAHMFYACNHKTTKKMDQKWNSACHFLLTNYIV